MSADLALAADPSVIERAADPGEFIVQACERAKTWLREALEHGDIEQIAECKSQAEAIRVYTMSKQLGKDAEAAATEIVRRAERGIGLAIRRGQADGTIRQVGNSGGPRRDYTRQNGRVVHVDRPDSNRSISSPTDFATEGELSGNGTGIYHLADGVSEQDFEAALAQAKAEGNLSRANVVRKVRARNAPPGEWIPERTDTTPAAAARRRELIRSMAAEGYSSRQMSERLGTLAETIRQIARDQDIAIPADEVIGGTRHHDSNRIVAETVHAMAGLALGIGLIEPGDLDASQAKGWADSLTASIRTLNRLIKTLKETAQ